VASKKAVKTAVKVKTTMRQAINQRWLWLAVNAAAPLPLLWAAWDFAQGNLIDPIDSLTVRTGQSAIILLLLSLAVTPLVTLTGFRPLATVRKSLGLWAFAYAVLHLLVFVGLDYAFNLDFILRDGLQRKPYILAGAAAVLALLPLALTSTKGWMKRLGRRWKQLHRLAYAAGVLAALHYVWVAKLTVGQPAIYASILAVLLLARIPPLRRALAVIGRQMRGKPSTARISERTTVASIESRGQ
jgi:sulfoxide reductase heme-binding subunit YedZ